MGRACVPGTSVKLLYPLPYLPATATIPFFADGVGIPPDPMVRVVRGAMSALSFGDTDLSVIPLGRLEPLADSPRGGLSSPFTFPRGPIMTARSSPVAGIDVGDQTHWVCVEQTPDGSPTTREFPAHTPGLRELMAWLRHCGVTTIALEATGAYGHVLFLSLLEAGWHVIITSPKFTRQIQGRPKTDRLDCQWIQRLHRHGLLPSVFQPDEPTQTLRDFVRQRANLVRLSGHHIQRMQKALELMNLKLTNVVEDVTGVTGLKIIRAILSGERDPVVLAKLRDRRCKRTESEIATALDGRYRDEHLLELRCCCFLWEQYLQMIQEVDQAIAVQLRR
ncbi:MAG: IS110 family transposase, partial [Gemmataceae bacterium]